MSLMAGNIFGMTYEEDLVGSKWYTKEEVHSWCGVCSVSTEQRILLSLMIYSAFEDYRNILKNNLFLIGNIEGKTGNFSRKMRQPFASTHHQHQIHIFHSSSVIDWSVKNPDLYIKFILWYCMHIIFSWLLLYFFELIFQNIAYSYIFDTHYMYSY